MWVKVHTSSRRVVAVCDEDLLGKKFEQDIRQLNVTESFYKGQKLSKEDTIALMRLEFKEGSTFNIVGKEAVKTAVEARIIEKGAESKVKNIPFILIVN